VGEGGVCGLLRDQKGGQAEEGHLKRKDTHWGGLEEGDRKHKQTGKKVRIPRAGEEGWGTIASHATYLRRQKVGDIKSSGPNPSRGGCESGGEKRGDLWNKGGLPRLKA